MINYIDLILHIDEYLSVIIQTYDVWTYLILFLVIFVETGVVFTPFLPGDSLLFAAGTFAGMGALNIGWILAILMIAAILGDTLNYAIGRYLGEKLAKRADGRFLRREYLERTNTFYKKYGKKTVVLARFIPIIRTFAPFVAGIGKMNYWDFLRYNVLGAILWVTFFCVGGYYFGQLPIVQENFSLVIIVIIISSFIPVFIEFWRHKRHKETEEPKTFRPFRAR